MALVARLIQSPDELSALESQWWDLWHRSPAATPFQSPAWLLPWWRHFHPGPLMGVAVFEDSKLVGLAPHYLEDGTYGRRLLPLGIGISDQLDLLIDPDIPGIGEAIIAPWLESAERWDILELEELGPDAAALALPCPAGYNLQEQAQSSCPGLTLAGEVDGDGLPLELSAKRRWNVRRARAAAEQRGGLRLIAPEPEPFFEILVRLHSARWQAKGESGVLADPRVLAFQREALLRLTEAGFTRLWVTEIGGKTVGAIYGLNWRNHAAFYLSGFDPDFSAESPVTILLGQLFTLAALEKARDFSFLRGQEPYKYFWGASDRWNIKRSIVRRSR